MLTSLFCTRAVDYKTGTGLWGSGFGSHLLIEKSLLMLTSLFFVREFNRSLIISAVDYKTGTAGGSDYKTGTVEVVGI